MPKEWQQCDECGIWFEAYACQKRRFCGQRCSGLHSTKAKTCPLRAYRASLQSSGVRHSVLEMHGQGLHQSEIARRLGVSKQRVSQIVAGGKR